MKSTDALAPIGNTEFGFDNHNPDNIQSSDTINVVFVVDNSSSVASFSDAMEKAFNDMKNNLKKSHVREQIFFSTVVFNHEIISQTGFQPIESVVDVAFNCGGSTSLYRSARAAMSNAISYRTTLEDNGINCKTLFFIITDGADTEGNAGEGYAAEVKKMIDNLLAEERNFGSFTSILFGVGSDTYSFETAQKLMGIQQLALLSSSPEDVRKMIAFISTSISSTAMGGPAVSTANF